MNPYLFRAVHLGDLHFWRIPLNPLAYFSKRLLGVGNLIVGGRARKFRQDLLPLMGDRVASLGTDYLLESGDLTSTAWKSEFAAAREFLLPLRESARGGMVTVPGNHDCYTGHPSNTREFIRQVGRELGPVPLVELRSLPGDIQLLAINATCRNGLGSHGAFTPSHAALTEKLLSGVGRLSMIWVLCHFPHEHPAGALQHERPPQLHGGSNLVELLRAAAVPVLWLHGHHHYRWLYRSPTLSALTYLNAGAPALTRGSSLPDLGFHELLVNGPADLTIRTHSYDHGRHEWSTRDTQPATATDYVNLQGG